MSRFEPVFWPEGRGLGDGVSMTFLRHFDLCPRSGFLYQLHRGEASTTKMQRGKLGHRALELIVRAAIENGEVTVPPELAKAIADEVMADPEYAVPLEEHDYVREAIFRFAEETAIDPGAVVACETLFEMDVAGWRVRCRVDFAELLDKGARVVVRDYKFSPSAPPYDEIARKRSDGTFAAKTLQLVLYAMVLVYGVPVREEECARCFGSGWIMAVSKVLDDPTATGKDDCPICGGKGRIEIREPFPVASRAQVFETEYVYPGIEIQTGDDAGKMLRRPLTLTRSELEAYRPSLEALLGTLSYRIESGDWPAVMSDAGCDICPAKRECPIPQTLRDFRGEINTPAQAAEAFEKAETEKKINAALQKERRAFVKAHGPVRFGRNMVAEIGFQESTRIPSKDAMFEAQDRAVRFGEPFDRAQWVKAVQLFPLVVRELSADELLEESLEQSIAEGSG